ncbi:t-complex protein 1 subunit delta [Trichonephila clavipes]|nr:t-complex protein 1 subunit delta [Trichonephila clavipes]
MSDTSNHGQFVLSIFKSELFAKVDLSCELGLGLFPEMKSDFHLKTYLFGFLNSCFTGAGERLLIQWIKQPLIDIRKIANESGQIVSEDIAVCKLCRSPVSAKSGSTSNLFGHLRLHYPLQFSEVSYKSKVVTATVQYSPFYADVDEPQPLSNMAVSESNQFNFVDNHRHKRQKFMTDFQWLDDQASKRTTDSVTKFLVCTMQPYNLVDRKEFINMVKVLNPRYSLPGGKHFTATAVPKLYKVNDKIRQELSLINKDTISVTTDCWTSIANTPYITITVHFITSEWALKSACLACAHFDDDHNGKNIAEVLRSILNDLGIDV